MKLAVTQIILGIILVATSFWVTGWMINDAPEAFDKINAYIETIKNQPGLQTSAQPIPELLFTFSRICSYILPVMGLLLVSVGTAQLFNNNLNKTKLAITNILVGVIIIGILSAVIAWGYPQVVITYATTEVTKETLESLKSPTNFVYVPLLVYRITFISFLLTIAAIVIGITQLVKSRKKAIT